MNICLWALVMSCIWAFGVLCGWQHGIGEGINVQLDSNKRVLAQKADAQCILDAAAWMHLELQTSHNETNATSAKVKELISRVDKDCLCQVDLVRLYRS